jgi:hypothetical protein
MALAPGACKRADTPYLGHEGPFSGKTFMRVTILAAAVAASIGFGAGAQAAPARVDVAIGPELQAKAVKTYGLREVRGLAERLRERVQRELARTGAYADSHVVLELTDAVPNRPTFKQMSDRPGLSFDSFGIGGAEIEGHVVSPDGRVQPVSYRYYDTSIRDLDGVSTWYEADWTIGRFARDLAHGQAFARR